MHTQVRCVERAPFCSLEEQRIYIRSSDHTLLAPSPVVVTRVVPLGANTHDITQPVWPVRVHRWDQSLVHHTRAVLSAEVVTSVLPSGANAHEVTASVWPVSSLTVRTEGQSKASGARCINWWPRVFHCLRIPHHQLPLDSCPPYACIQQLNLCICSPSTVLY